MGVFSALPRTNSVLIAKDRLKLLLSSDRAECTPDMLEFLKNDLYHAISKYMTVDREAFRVHLKPNEIHIFLRGEDL